MKPRIHIYTVRVQDDMCGMFEAVCDKTDAVVSFAYEGAEEMTDEDRVFLSDGQPTA